jgi:hypothetical protein
MSAGGLSYSGLVNYGASTLPSVESWGNNINILKDPPKSIMTRRINKVGETSSITEMIDSSGDRAAETILVYPRGINPMVSVSYNNYGNNAGLNGSLPGLSQNFSKLAGSGSQSFLPYRIMNGQNFRPPIQSPQDLMPLSRQPRVWTSQYTTPGFVDFSKKLRDQGTAETTKEVKTNTLKAFVRPTHIRQIEKPLEKPNEVKYSIQKVMALAAHSGHRTMDVTQQHVNEPTKEIYSNPLHYDVTANLGDLTKYVNNNEFNPDKYIQETNVHSVPSNRSGFNQSNIDDILNTDAVRYTQETNAHSVPSNRSGFNQTNIDDILNTDAIRYTQETNAHSVPSNRSGMKQTNIDDLIDTTKYIQDIQVIDYNTPQSIQGDGTKYIHDNLQRDRVLPNYQATTNIIDSRTYKSNDYTNSILLERNMPNANFEGNGNVVRTEDPNGKFKSIIPKISPGAYMVNNSSKPLTERIQKLPTIQESEKSKMSKFITNEMEGRY